jgi:outer membrane protein OmpA-like peptidoglycan-associated protein
MGIDEPDAQGEPDMTRYLSTLALAIAAALLTPQAKAEKIVIYREGQLVNPQDVAAVLGKTRSIRLLDDEPAAPPKLTPVAAVSPAKISARSSASARIAPDDSKADASALSLPVRFAFDSADILPAARVQLDALAEGIKLLAPESIVTVEGHTDAVGSDAYNLDLSRVRAHAVRDYLVQRHGIDAARLKTVAYGEGRPLEGSDPNAALNRRVQFRGA